MATRSQDDDKRLCLIDDLKEVQVHIQVKVNGTSSSLNSKITTSCSQDNVKKNKSASTRLKTKHSILAFADADHAGCQDTRKSTSGSMQLLGDRL
ncbi:hypothetical protein Tco_1559815, partial [Tanacetum coccineum]